MQAIEFEATSFQHTIRIPDTIPDGVSLRVLLLVDEETNNDGGGNTGKRFKSLLKNIPNVGSDEDFSRPTDNDKTRQSAKFSPLPAKLKLSRDELNDRRPDYQTMTVNEIEIPPRDERYDR
jgi:hypothetical protein